MSQTPEEQSVVLHLQNAIMAMRRGESRVAGQYITAANNALWRKEAELAIAERQRNNRPWNQ